MKKIINIICYFVFLVFLSCNHYLLVKAATPTLDEIAKKFNYYETYNKYYTQNTTQIHPITASISGNTLNLQLANTLGICVYTLNGDILSGDLKASDNYAECYNNAKEISAILADSVAQLHDVQADKVYNTIMGNDADYYTLDNQGIAITTQTDEYKIEMDISKTYPTVNVSLKKVLDNLKNTKYSVPVLNNGTYDFYYFDYNVNSTGGCATTSTTCTYPIFYSIYLKNSVGTKIELYNFNWNSDGSGPDYLDIKYNPTSSDINLKYGNLIARYILDAIGQAHGYAKGQTYSTFYSDEIKNYNGNDEGVIITEADGEKKYTEIFNKKLPLVSNNAYFTTSNIADLVNNSSYNKILDNMILDVKENVILVGEYSSLTSNTYKSILSALEIKYGSTVAQYFKSNYSDLSVGSYKMKGINIEVNPSLTNYEQAVFGTEESYKVVRLSVDTSAFENNKTTDNSNDNTNTDDNSSINTTDSTSTSAESTNNTKSNVTKSIDNPNTGAFLNIILIVLSTFIISLILYYLKKKNKFYKI